MRARVKRLAGVVVGVVAIGGVFAAPVSAQPPGFIVFQACETTDGSGQAFAADSVAGPAQHFAIAEFNAALKENNTKCVPGTRVISVERVP